VLPDIKRQKGYNTISERSIRIARVGNVDAFCSAHKPGPAAAKLSERGTLERIAKPCQVSESILNRISQRTFRLSTSIRRHAAPQEVVIPGLGSIIENAAICRVMRRSNDHRK